MSQLRLRRGLALVASLGLLLALSAAPGVPAAVAAADDGIDVRTASTYTLVPKDRLVHVVVDVTARNTSPSTTSGNIITRYFFNEIHLALQPEAAHARATQDGQRAGHGDRRRKGYVQLALTFRAEALLRPDRPGPGDLRPARRQAPLEERHPGRGGLRHVLRLGQRRPGLDPDRPARHVRAEPDRRSADRVAPGRQDRVQRGRDQRHRPLVCGHQRGPADGAAQRGADHPDRRTGHRPRLARGRRSGSTGSKIVSGAACPSSTG